MLDLNLYMVDYVNLAMQMAECLGRIKIFDKVFDKSKILKHKSMPFKPARLDASLTFYLPTESKPRRASQSSGDLQLESVS